MNTEIKKFAVLGHPISHSLSPQIHSLFAKQFSINLEYKKFDINKDSFLENVKRLKHEGYYGLNITLPLKYSAFQICENLSERASLCKSVNTITFEDKNIIGDSTDGRGLINDLDKKGINIKDKNIFLVGAGGAANGVIYDLILNNPKKIFLTNRTFAKAIEMKAYWQFFADKHQVNLDVIDSNFKTKFDLIINATSASLSSLEPPIPLTAFDFLNVNGSCYDMMYGIKTPFINASYKKTNSVFDGLGMLIEQAAESFKIWHQLNPKTIDIQVDLKNL